MVKLRPLIITGPTASGKSSYALNVARAENGIIINADSMQIYKDLPILTAHPTEPDLKQFPHRLYGVLEGKEICSVALWRELALEEMKRCEIENKRAIFVGGTGLYLSALTKGLSSIPEIDPQVRQEARLLFQGVGASKFHQILKEIDPEIAQRLKPNDKQRLIRAYEVIKSTGKSLTYWHNDLSSNGIECEIKVINRPRDILWQRAESRFHQMLSAGAVEEVKALLEKAYNPSVPLMKALGVQEIKNYLEGQYTREECIEKTVISTHQYIKRQSTWFRHQFPEAENIEACE